MSLRCLISLVASSVLFGCAGDRPVLKDTPRPLALNWDRADWRFCEAAECAKPTPKTVLLVPSPKIIQPVAVIAPKSVLAFNKTRTISVLFQFSSAMVTSEAEKIIRKEVAQLVTGDSIRVEGRTDDLGSQAFNDRLAHKRAVAVVTALKRLGSKGEIELQSQGKCCYAMANRSEASRAKNRRVDLQISTTQKE
jgi:outer membrane protein OmpA-like peptidoglycan-associated protein